MDVPVCLQRTRRLFCAHILDKLYAPAAGSCRDHAAVLGHMHRSCHAQPPRPQLCMLLCATRACTAGALECPRSRHGTQCHQPEPTSTSAFDHTIINLGAPFVVHLSVTIDHPAASFPNTTSLLAASQGQHSFAPMAHLGTARLLTAAQQVCTERHAPAAPSALCLTQPTHHLGLSPTRRREKPETLLRAVLAGLAGGFHRLCGGCWRTAASSSL